MAVGHLFQTYLPDNKSLTQFLGQWVQAGTCGMEQFGDSATSTLLALDLALPTSTGAPSALLCLLKKKENTLLCCQGPVACRMR